MSLALRNPLLGVPRYSRRRNREPADSHGSAYPGTFRNGNREVRLRGRLGSRHLLAVNRSQVGIMHADFVTVEPRTVDNRNAHERLRATDSATAAGTVGESL